MPEYVLSAPPPRCTSGGVSCGPMKTPDTTPDPLLSFQLDPEPATDTLTAFGGLPLVAQTFRSLGLPQSVARHLHLKQRQRGVEEATTVESFVLLNAAGGADGRHSRRNYAAAGSGSGERGPGAGGGGSLSGPTDRHDRSGRDHP